MKKTIIAFVLAATADLHAGTVTGAIRGRVMIGTEGVRDASVTAACYGSAAVLVTVTGKEGFYWLPTLTPGICEVTVAREGLQTLTQRVEVRAGDETRADVELEASTEGESVTSTSVRRPLLERSEVVWAIDEETFELLPTRRSADALAALAPGRAFTDGISSRVTASLEGIERERPAFAVLDAIGRADVIVAGAGPLYASAGPVLLTIPPHGTLELTARATGEHLRGRARGVVDVTAAGIVHERLHLFSATRAGSLFERDESDWLVSADSAPFAATSVRAVAVGGSGATDWSLRTTHVANRAITFDALASDGRARVLHARGAMLVVSGRSVHALRAGVERRDPEDRTSFFADDHWRIGERVAIDAGARIDDGGVWPRLGVMFDPSPDGRQRLSASVAEYGDAGDRTVRETALSYAQQFDGGTAITATFVRRERSAERATEGVMLDAVYRYLVFSFGGNLTVAKQHGELTDSANVWVIADAPLLEHDVNLSLLQRVRDGFLATDFAATYAWSAGRLTPSAKLELENVFGSRPAREDPDQRPRAVRLSVGVRFGLD